MSYREYSKLVFVILLAAVLLAPVVLWAKIIECSGVIGISCPIVPCTECSLEDLIELTNRLINFGLYQVAAPLAIIALMWGGFQMMTAGGDQTKLESGKKIFYYAVTGFIVAFGAFLIVKLILTTLAGPETITNLQKYLNL